MISRRGFFGVTLGLWAGAWMQRKTGYRRRVRHARTHYVDSRRGSDGNDGLSIDSPLATLSAAFARSATGDTIIVRPS